MIDGNPIKIRKGLDIPIGGAAERRQMSMLDEVRYAVRPMDHVGMVPRLLVAEGDSVCVGTPLVEDKGNDALRLVSPVSGTVTAVVRGEKRRLLSVVVTSNGKQEQEVREHPDALQCCADELREHMVAVGLWSLLEQRPFGIVPKRDARPKALFLSGFDSGPLAVDMDYMLQGREEDFAYGVAVLRRLIETIYLSLDWRRQRDSLLAKTEGVEVRYFDGPHPAGLVGTQINKIAPLNKGEQVWTIDLQSVAIIGHYFRTGELDLQRLVALCGPTVPRPCYVLLRQGACIEQMASLVHPCPSGTPSNQEGEFVRFVGGDVLSGVGLERDGFMPAKAAKLCVLPEGNRPDLLGWLRPNIHKYSHSRTFLSGLLRRPSRLTLDFDTGLHGGHRPLFVTGDFERLVPLDIYPMQLIKACMAGDMEQMEELGIYEVEPEDLALCEFADTSKTEIQKVVRDALEQLRKEG